MHLGLNLILIGHLFYVQGGFSLIHISSTYVRGNVIFNWWTTTFSSSYDVSITRDAIESPWVQVHDTTYTVNDSLLYNLIIIKVRSANDSQESIFKHKVMKVEVNVGDSVNISWIAPSFPRAGAYNIYHSDKVDRSIIQVTYSGTTLDQTKYEYQSRPYDSTNITFVIRDITLADAGYYNGGTNVEAAWNGGGVVLIVHEKPLKPTIKGSLDIMVDSYTYLTCFSHHTSKPDYFTRLTPLSYIWFENDKMIIGETKETHTLRVTADHKNNQYSCTAKDKLESERSDTVQFNILMDPRLHNHQPVAIHSGFRIGLKETLHVKIPVLSNPQPTASSISWKASDGRIIKSKGVVFQQPDDLDSYIIISIVPIPGDKQNEKYSVYYDEKLLTNITNTIKEQEQSKEDLFESFI